MSKSKTYAKRKREKPETATKAKRCKWDPSYCAKVEKLGADVASAWRSLVCSPEAIYSEPRKGGLAQEPLFGR